MLPIPIQKSQYVSRASGDDVTPLRIDLVGCIEHPQLHLTSEDNETPNVLAVEVRADVLFDGDVTVSSVCVCVCVCVWVWVWVCCAHARVCAPTCS